MTATESSTALDELCIDTIRTLSMDAVQKANSGPPGGADGRWRRSPTRCTRA